MNKMFAKTYDIFTSKKGQLGLLGIVLISVAVFKLKGTFGEYSLALITILTAMGLGFQQDKKMEKPALFNGDSK